MTSHMTSRAIAVAIALAIPTIAAAELPRGVVWQNRVKLAPTQSVGVAARTAVSHKLYMNACAGGCTVYPGTDNSMTNRSSIPVSTVVLPAYPHGTESWNKLVQCVKDTFAPFTIEVVTTDPGSTPHFEVMVGGASTTLNPDLVAGGVAPFISCGAQDNNIISFVFPEGTSDLNFLCGAVVQEAAHVWGLDHELDAKDPLTYLDLGSLKRFQNSDAQCGESRGSPRACYCGGSTQNTFRYMNQTFGLSPMAEPTLAITQPRDGAWVKPGFPIGAQLTSPLDAISAKVKIDATVAATLATPPFAINAPTTITAGEHMLTVEGADAGDRIATSTIKVHVMTSCAMGEKCTDGTHCMQGICMPGSNVDGGLGATCSTNTDCITNSCASNGEESRCTATCDAGNSCPSGYDCLGAGDQSVCWPADTGGCSTGGRPYPLLALGLLFLVRRRRH